MNCERARDYLIEYCDHRLPGSTASEVRAHLASCPACQSEFSALGETLGALDAQPPLRPSPRLRLKVRTLIDAEMSPKRTAPRESHSVHRFWWLAPLQGLAACALLAIGFVVGEHRSPAPAPAPVVDPAAQREIADLRARVDSMGQVVNASLLGQSSANDRLRGVLADAAVPHAGQNVIDNLITTLALDPSVNVRLNALQALYAHSDQDVVRAGVLESLPRESSPLVQVAMIDFLVASRDREAGGTFQSLSDNTSTDPDVRVAAKRALSEY